MTRQGLLPRATMGLLYHGQKAADVITTALNLGLLRALDDGPITLRELSFSHGLVPGRLYKFLDCLESLGFLEIKQESDDILDAQYRSCEPLCEAAERVFGAHSIERVRDQHGWQNIYGRLPALLRGELGMEPQAFAWPPMTSAQAAEFETSMAASIGPIIASFVAARAALLPPISRLTGGGRLLDVGGGDGTLGLALVQKFGDLRVDVYNLPVIKPLVEQKAQSAAADGRLGFVGGDFLIEDLPADYDAMSFVRVLFDWPAAVVKALLKKVLAALPPSGRLFICEEFRTPEQLATEFFWQYFLIGVDSNPYRLREKDFYLLTLRELGFQNISVCPGPREIIAATRP